MKTPWIVLLVVLVGSGIAEVVLWQSESARVTALSDQIAKLKAENAKLTANVADAKEKAATLEEESAQLRAARAVVTTQMAPEASPTPAEKPKDQGNFLAKMFKDPEMRKMLAAQQTTALKGYYADFIKQARLTPDEADRFFNLLQDRQMAMMDSSAAMFSGSSIDQSAISSATETANTALKDMLGDQRFGMYQDFEKTLGSRIALQQFSQQLGSSATPLQDSQSQALIQIMTQEQANMPNFQSPNGSGMNQLANMSQTDIDQYSQQIDQMNQRVYQRASSVLTPQQLTAFQSFQNQMGTMQKAGLKMASQMFQGKQ